jgi:hypothetical protein
MDILLRDEKITAFVRDVLGCGCPDEVFNKIEVANIELAPDSTIATRIVIGDTLLIYILPDTPAETVVENIRSLVATGKQDRDTHGYNRFRLVLRSRDRKDLEESATNAFAAEVAGDEKLHLHFVAAVDLEWLC